jgi:putative tryptophan/tyrosine transport system substrate-binding protein
MAIKTVVALLVGLALASVHVAEGQQQAKVIRVGWLANRPDTGIANRTVLRQMLAELGYVEGKNIAFEFRFADNEPDRFLALADELVRLKVDLIFVSDPNAAPAAKNATRTIPIVFLLGGDPVVAGLVDSFARPGGNITGFTDIATVLGGKRLELLKEIPNSPALRFCGIHGRALNNGKKANWRHVSSVCSFIR